MCHILLIGTSIEVLAQCFVSYLATVLGGITWVKGLVGIRVSIQAFLCPWQECHHHNGI